MDTLAVQLAVPLAGPARDFNPRESAPCRAHQKKAALTRERLLSFAQSTKPPFPVPSVSFLELEKSRNSDDYDTCHMEI
jgi:hypothetical protein